MPTVADCSPLLTTRTTGPQDEVSEHLLGELTDLAMSHDSLAARSRLLFEQLRKMVGQDRFGVCLGGLLALAVRGEPAGARLLAAFLDSNTSGSQLLPRVLALRSTRRLACHLQRHGGKVEDLGAWAGRLEATVTACEAHLGTAAARSALNRAPATEPGSLALLRQSLRSLAPESWGQRTPADAEVQLLARLVELETEATQERVGHLAGTIDPFRVSIIVRALPLLSRTDAEIRDLQNFASWLDEGDLDTAFRRRVPRFQEVMDAAEHQRFADALHAQAKLKPLAELHDALLARPLAVRDLAGPLARLLALGQRLVEVGARTHEIDPVTGTLIALEHSDGGQLRVPLDEALAAVVGRILLSGTGGGLAGLALESGALVLRDPSLALGDRVWRHDLPTLGEMTSPDMETGVDAIEEEDDADVDTDDTTQVAVKRMVLNNLGCVSILLGFLRNPKVVAIPGLVADIARRSRSVRVLEVIATDRALHSGFVNKEVPRALLESPVNVPVKTLRKFIHVKYVSKTDLKRLAQDKARLRKEVIAEIHRYLESLV